jgi:phage-related minor tail protein
MERAMEETVETWRVEVEADARPLQRELANAAAFGRQFGHTLTSAFEGVALRGKSLGDVLRGLSFSLSRMAFNAAFKPLEQGLGEMMRGLLAGSVSPFARGAAFKGGLPVPFAAGGIIASPVTFPMANGRLGLAGEQGAEAIMPLARGPDGRLGVRASGAGGGTNITFNIATPDAESFRRSEPQIAALLARAVAQGQRNL